IDRGGTFTDCIGSIPVPKSNEYPKGRKEVVIKLLSVDPQNYPDAPREGIRRILELATGKDFPKNKPIDTSFIVILVNESECKSNLSNDVYRGISGEYVRVIKKL
ncbi:18439_t:CDS:2, partial [Entrophospora sp. SA101]